MKTFRLLLFVILLSLSIRLPAFEWPGGTMTVPVTCYGTEVFAGYVPRSPWGSSTFTNDPVLQLRDSGNRVVAQFKLTGGAADWYDGGSRSASVTFTAPAGAYTLVGQAGTRHVLIPGEGWSGFRLDFAAIPDPVPPNSAPTIAWNSAPTPVGSGQSYTVSAHGHDDDGNLTQVNIWKNGQPFAFAGGGNGTDSDSGNPTSDSGPQSITFTAQAVDAAGAVSATISQTVTINAPPPAQYTLTTVAGAGGTVSTGGVFTAGSLATVSASADATHDFAGWSGDGSGTTNPLGVLMDRDKTVQANFSPKSFALVTSTSGGGGVSPGGTYPYGATVTVTATPDATHRFTGWAGDASGTAPSITLSVTRSLAVQAVFDPKTAQTISFPAIADQNVGASFPLNITTTSGLPVTVVVTGPASYAAGVLTLTGPGAVSVQATQAGDDTYLAAAPVVRAFNSAASVVLRYRAAGRTLLQSSRTVENIPYVIQPNP